MVELPFVGRIRARTCRDASLESIPASGVLRAIKLGDFFALMMEGKEEGLSESPDENIEGFSLNF